MSGAHPGRRAPETRAMQLPVSGQMLTQMDHLMRQGCQQRRRMTVVGIADPDSRLTNCQPRDLITLTTIGLG